MCDLTEVIYSPNDVVWVKLGPVWWPGRVCGEDEIPPEIMKDLRKTPIAIVKFFQEDSFEYVKSLSNIYHYHCPRKNEFIKKGLDMLRSKNRGAPSNMKLFPEDVVRAETLTGGNPAILQSDAFLPEERPAYSDLFVAKKKTPKRLKPEVKRKPAADPQPTTPRLITHPRFLQLSSGQSTDYEVRERQQTPIRAECDQEDAAPAASYSCVDCGYTTSRLNVMVWHNKSHTHNYASTPVSKPTKRKSVPATIKLKERTSSSPSAQPTVDTEAVSAAKIPKTNGQLRVGRPPKTPGRKKGVTTKKTSPAPTTKVAQSSEPRVPAQKGRRGSAHKGDEIHQSLLDDWLEDDADMEEPLSPVERVSGDSGALTNGSATSDDAKGKSCFDFDDSEDHLVIDESKFKPGRKIPRLLDKTAPSALADDVALDDAEGEAAPVECAAKYQSGVEDSMDGESSLGHSQLQVMGVDNEIEIKSEDVLVDEEVVESVPPKKSRRNLKTDKKAIDDADLLHDQVDKLLNEVSTAPVKIPDLPRSHKKKQLKAYQLQAEAEEQAAQKAAAEAEAAQKAAAEAEAAQKAAAEAEAAQKAAAEVEAAQKAAAEAEAAQKAVAEAEVAQKAAAEAEAAQKAAAEAEAAQKAAAEAAAQKAADEASAALIAASEAQKQAEAAQKAASKAEAIQETATTAETAHIANEQATYDLHPETMNIDVSSIPLPSPQEGPVTREPVESSINIGASVTVENETSNEPTKSPAKVSGEVTGAKSIATEASVAEVQATVTSSSQSQLTPNSAANIAKVSDTPIAENANTPVKCSTLPKVTKPVNATLVQHSGQPTLKFISQNDYKLLMNKLNASIGQGSPSKTSDQPLRAIKTTIKVTGGKSLVSNLGQPKVLVANSQTSGSPSKFLIVTNYKQPGTASATTTTNTATPGTTTLAAGARSINLAHATTLRVSPNILQKSAAAQRAAAALAKSSGKNIVLDASTFQSLFQTQPQQLQKMQAQVAAATSKSQPSIVAAPSQHGIVLVADGNLSATNSKSGNANPVSSSSAGQTIDYNYIVDSSGNLVQVDEPPTVSTPTKSKDILAKALEDTDGLQTEMALSEAASNNVLDSTQSTDITYKTGSIYENVTTLNTAPIMSAFETPSSVAATANVLEEAVNEVEMVQSGGANSGSQYLT